MSGKKTQVRRKAAAKAASAAAGDPADSFKALLPQSQIDQIIGEASGETSWNTVSDIMGYDRIRPEEEFLGTAHESRCILDRLAQYGLPGSQLIHYPIHNPNWKSWNASVGELWEIAPRRQKLASIKDMPSMLFKGSGCADVKGDLVWVGRGTKGELADLRVGGKIVVTENGDIGGVHHLACIERGAVGMVAISDRSGDYIPLMTGIGGKDGKPARFGFFLTQRDGTELKRRLVNGEKITVRAQVETKELDYDFQTVVCHIPGTDPDAGELIFSAHLFEGIVAQRLLRQGANDNGSGSAAILEVARVLHTLIEDGRLPRPRRTIRFVWAQEWWNRWWVNANMDIIKRTLCNINMDQVGANMTRRQCYLTLGRTGFGNPHFVNDVTERFFDFIGNENVKVVPNGRMLDTACGILAPTGSTDPFHYRIDSDLGGSDQMVFNNWGVQVPGVMLVNWPEHGWHSSGDRPDHVDPTQMRRVVIIGAAAGYAIAAADEDMALRIGAEAAGRGARRLAAQFARRVSELDAASAQILADAYRLGRIGIQYHAEDERNALDTILQLAPGSRRVRARIDAAKKGIDQLRDAYHAALKMSMRLAARRLKVPPVRIQLTETEKRASRIIPAETDKVRVGFELYEETLKKTSDANRKKYPHDISVPWDHRTNNLHRMIDGRRSILELRDASDAQYSRKTDIRSVMNYIQVLKLAGLVTTRESR